MQESSASLSTNTRSKLVQLAELLQQASFLAREISLPHSIPKDQEWFWSDAWQAAEREVDEQFARGEYDEFDSMEDAIADLHKHL